MARWILDRPREYSDSTELRVAEWLADLPDEWVIRWGFSFTDGRGLPREGDFLVLGPQGGLLVMEVKGGRLNHMAAAGRWNTENGDHPVTQLMVEWRAVVDKVGSPVGDYPPLFADKVLALPQLELPDGDSSYLGIERKLILTGKDLRDFRGSWNRLFSANGAHLDGRQREQFFKTYGAEATAKAIRHFVTETERVFLRQTAANYELLDWLQDNRQFLVRGGTGTGKTWLALELAFRWAEETKGDVLFLCYNLALAHLLKEFVATAKARAKPKKGRVVVMSWEEMARSLLEEAGVGYDSPPEDLDDRFEYFTETIPALLIDLVRSGEIRPRFSALVVDEAQDHDTTVAGMEEKDLGPGWWAVYWPLLHEGRATRTALYYDEAQRQAFREANAFDPAELALALRNPVRIQLQAAVRYTAPIFQFLQTLRSKATEKLLAGFSGNGSLPDGPDVVVAVARPEAVVEVVEEILQDWIGKGFCKPEQVLILSPYGRRAKSCLGECGKIGPWRVIDFLEQKPGCISTTSVNKAKGLDALAVILIDFRPFEEIENPGFQAAYFMGASRARQLLAVVHVEREASSVSA
jgi:hypothetical protein